MLPSTLAPALCPLPEAGREGPGHAVAPTGRSSEASASVVREVRVCGMDRVRPRVNRRQRWRGGSRRTTGGALVASALFARLEEMYLGSTLHPVTVRRDGDDLHVTVVGYDGPVESWLPTVLDALPAERVASFSLAGHDVSKSHARLAKRFPRVREVAGARTG